MDEPLKIPSDQTKDHVIQFFERLIKDKKKVEAGQVPCNPTEERGYLESVIGTDIPEDGLGFEGALQTYEHLEKMSAKWKHPLFFGYFPCTISDAGLVGGLVQSLAPAYNSTLEINKEESDLEKKLLDKICELLKLPEKFKWKNGGVGLLNTSAGNNSVLSVHIAKHKKLKDLGLPISEVTKLVGYYPAYNHSHCVKAFVLNGISELRKVPVIYSQDEGNFTMDLEVLKAWLKEDKSKGLIPFATFAAHGATSCTGNDDFEALSKICKSVDMLMITDGAYSGAFLRNDKYQAIREALVHSDFYILNLSKVGYCGGESAVIFHCHRQAHLDAFKLGNYDTISCNEYRLGNNTKTAVMKILFSLSCISMDDFEKHLCKTEENAETLSKMLVGEHGSRFERFPPNSRHGLLCIRGKFNNKKFDLPAQEGEMKAYRNKMNRELLHRVKVKAKEDMFILGAENNEEYYFRFSCQTEGDTHLYGKVAQVFNAIYDEMLEEETACH